MKTMSFLRTFIIIASVCLFSFKCEDTIDPSDQTAPQITILTPSEGATFYTEGGVDTPIDLVMNAIASDSSNIKMGYIRVYDSYGAEKHDHDEFAALQGVASLTEVYSSFSTTVPGEYTIEFGFEDVNNNLATATRNVICVFSEESEGEN